MRKIHLQLFVDPTYSVTCYADSGFDAFSASPNSSVAKDATVTLTVTPKTGYEVKDIIVISGGVTVHQDNNTISFACGEANVVLYAVSQKNNEYKVTENRDVYVNDSKTALKRNLTEVLAPNGAIAEIKCNPTTITLDAGIVAELVQEGVLVKDNPAWKGTPTPSA